MSVTSDSSTEMSHPFRLAFDVTINVRHVPPGSAVHAEDPVYGHRFVLSAHSPLFRRMLQCAEFNHDSYQLPLDLSIFPNALNSFRAMVLALYTGNVCFENAQAAEILAVSRACQVASLEPKLAPLSLDLSSIFNNKPVVDEQPKNPLQAYIQAMMSMWAPTAPTPMFPITANPLFSLFPSFQPTSPVTDDSGRTHSDSRSSGSSPRANSMATPPVNDNEKIVPNDDKEGWCRNKKYIEKVEGGFMCTVCRKIYGRYNSVSYHVTIYHRNPPIKCDEVGCNFSTREARYIHFHKYYRHHTPLPDNIDLGSRKCPFCRHVSKSPAMLEKHVSRHENDNAKKAREAALQSAKKEEESMIETPNTSLIGDAPLLCTLCNFTSDSTQTLFLHLATVHLDELSKLNNDTSLNEPSENIQPVIDENNTLMAVLNRDLSIPLTLDTTM